jgi:hypothetical protein
MRDSLFWQTTVQDPTRPDSPLGLQVYLFVTGTGAAGFTAAVWGRDGVVARVQGGGRVDEATDFDAFAVGGAAPDDTRVGELRVANDGELRRSTVAVRSADLVLDLQFEGIHDAFSFHDNPDGLPSWFAEDRIEQTGRVSGELRLADRRLALGPLGHRDHSWGLRDWRAPQHWKWLVAYTDSGRAVNGWIWQARGEWGFAGYVVRDGNLVPIKTIDQQTTYDDAMQQRSLRATLHDVDGGATSLELDVFGILRLPDDRSGTTVIEGASLARIDGDPGVGQFETEWPTAYLAHLAGDA